MKKKTKHKPEVVRLKRKFRPRVVYGRRKNHNPQVITHGNPVLHVIITDARGGAVKIDADYLPSLLEILARVSLRNSVRHINLNESSN